MCFAQGGEVAGLVSSTKVGEENRRKEDPRGSKGHDRARSQRGTCVRNTPASCGREFSTGCEGAGVGQGAARMVGCVLFLVKKCDVMKTLVLQLAHHDSHDTSDAAGVLNGQERRGGCAGYSESNAADTSRRGARDGGTSPTTRVRQCRVGSGRGEAQVVPAGAVCWHSGHGEAAPAADPGLFERVAYTDIPLGEREMSDGP